MKILITIIITSISFSCLGQGKFLNLGYQNSGIGFGQPVKHNGIKLNFWDKESGKINGLNIAIFSKAKEINGVSLGLLVTSNSTMNGLQFGTIGNTTDKTNGISLGGLYISGSILNGIGVAGLALAADTLNGLFISGLGSSYLNTDSISQINGVTIGILAGSVTKRLNGLSIGLFHNVIGIQKGVCISAWNRARELHGIQIGLLNFAGNNRKIFRWLPLININLKKQTGNHT